MRNQMHYKVWDEITYPFPNLKLQLLKFENGWVISSHNLLAMWLIIRIVIKVNPLL